MTVTTTITKMSKFTTLAKAILEESSRPTRINMMKLLPDVPLRRLLMAGMLLVILCAVAAPAAAALQQPPPSSAAQDGFVPIDQLQPKEQLPAAPLVMAAYSVAWLVIFGYVWSIWRRLQQVEQEMASLSQRVSGGTRR
jgi:CcmD family protein